jgi:nucleotide-binding universal stress UspA family protein
VKLNQAGESGAWGSAEEKDIASEGFAMKLMDARTRVAVRNILMAVDFSPSSSGALGYATALAHRYGSRIYLAHVIRPDVYQLVSPEAMETVLEQTRHYAEQQMAKILVSGRLRGIPHQVLLGQGELWTIFSKLIDEHEIDLVVVGTQGRTGLEKMLIGSVAERVFRLAPCPVLTVGPRAPGEAPADAELQRVLYATDFSPEAGRAAAYALSLAQEQQATLMLVHVMDRAHEAASAEKPATLERLKALVPPEADLWCTPRYEIEFGSATDGILKAAGEYKADLIVMGVRHPDFSFSHLPPATAYKVVCRAPCPVLTVRG